MLRPVEWVGCAARIIDQTALPLDLRYEDVATPQAMFDAIRALKVRGAPLIGICAAYGVCLSLVGKQGGAARDQLADVLQVADYLATSRPTAVNLFWALERMQVKARALAGAAPGSSLWDGLVAEANAILDEDRHMCRAIGRNGFELIRTCKVVHTHCNAGALATGEFGTALAPVYTALEQGVRIEVIVDETRPLLQGARITAFELSRAGVPVTLICDNMAAYLMASRKVDAVIVGADRIAANGDVANKIGTYGLALAAHAHGVPFYVAAPSSTLDPSLSDGSGIPIEQRDSREVTCGMGRQTAPDGVGVWNPSFDVTPARLVSAIITENGVHRPPYAFVRG